MKPEYYDLKYVIFHFLPSFAVTINYCINALFIQHMSKAQKEITDKEETKYNTFLIM